MKQPWPWYVAGPLIGLTVPILLLVGNKSFGISSSLRHICASCMPADIPFFKYDWKRESWNLFFVLGIFIGGLLSTVFLPNSRPLDIHPDLVTELNSYGIKQYQHLIPVDIMNWTALFSFRGFIIMIVGGFFVGFGSRYAGGCTSGHAITGLATLQYPSLIATISFMTGGFLMANFILPVILGF